MLDVVERLLCGNSVKPLFSIVALAAGILPQSQAKLVVEAPVGVESGTISILAESHQDPSNTIRIDTVLGGWQRSLWIRTSHGEFSQTILDGGVQTCLDHWKMLTRSG